MDNIINIARQQVQPPTPTENAQIVFNYSFPSPAPIFRFNNAKKARKEYERIVKLWRNRRAGSGSRPVDGFVDIKADMFDGVIDLDLVAAVCFVEWPKRGKFIPRE